MAKLTIDNREVEVADGVTILDAAQKLGIEIPTMCFLKDYKPSTSCMICVVKVNGSDTLVPACATVAVDGMQIETDCDQVIAARKAALELLLSDHAGDCLGPCEMVCPAHMDIPLMIRQIAAGQLGQAIATVKKNIALPAVLGRVCPAPCENGCRRTQFDKPVSICLLKRFVADVDLASDELYMPRCEKPTGKKVAIVGAGPAGLSAAYYLAQSGVKCTIFEQREKAGGKLRYEIGEEELPRDIIDAEIALIEKLGIEFKFNVRVGSDVSVEQLKKDFDAVFVAVGQLDEGDSETLGLATGPKGIIFDNHTYQTQQAGVFAGGSAVRTNKLAIRSLADGKEAAVSIGQYLSGAEMTGPEKVFNTRIGKVRDDEKENFAGCSSSDARVEPAQPGDGFTGEQAVKEALRCMHCDCRKGDNCKLRDYSQQYAAKPTRYKGDRRLFVQQAGHPDIIYESGKCIDCGLCVQITSQAGEELGLTFIGRGFTVKVAVPFGRSIEQGLAKAAAQCVKACPTGALAFKDGKA